MGTNPENPPARNIDNRMTRLFERTIEALDDEHAAIAQAVKDLDDRHATLIRRDRSQ